MGNQPYTIDDADALQCKVENQTSNINYTASDNSCNSTTQSCPNAIQANKNTKENINCDFAVLKASKSGRNFEYSWSKSGGISKDGNNDVNGVYEIISGDTKIAELTIVKDMMVGPCLEFKHKGKSWDIEGYTKLDDKQITIKLPVPKPKVLSVQYFLPSDFSGKDYRINAIKCGGSQSILVKCYPDTELKLVGNFTFFEGNVSKTTYTGKEKNKVAEKEGGISLELKRNGAQSFKVDLFKYENSKTHEKSAYQGDYSKSAAGQYTDAKNQGAYSNEELEALKTFKALEEYRTKWNDFFALKDKLFSEFDNSATTPISFNITFLKAVLNLTAKWIEIPKSRYCDFQFSGNFSFSPLLSINVDFDFTKYITYIPYIGSVLALTDAFLETFKLGDLAIKFEIKGQIGLSSNFIDIRKRKIADSTNNSGITLTGEIGVTLRAYAKGKITVDKWHIKCGGEAIAEAGLKAKLADTETIYKEIKDSWIKKLNKQEKSDFVKLEDPEIRKSRLSFENGKIILTPKIGFSGLLIYTIAYAQAACSITSNNKDAPQIFEQSGSGSPLIITDTKNQVTHGVSFESGSKEEKVHTVLFPNPLIWQPKINLLGN